MWFWEILPAIERTVVRSQIDTQNLLKGQIKMSNELETLRATVAQIDAKGDAILKKLQEAIDRINSMVSSAVELAALKVAITGETTLLQEQVDQFDAALPPEPEVNPVG